MKIIAILINKFLSPRERVKLALLCISVTTALIPFTCCSSPESPEVEFMRYVQVELSYEDLRAQPNYSGSVQLRIDGLLKVILYSNATTGYSWSDFAQISDQTILKQIDHKFLPPKSDLTGAGGQEVWTFKTLNEGTSTIYLEYSQPWEGGDKAAKTFHLTVVVKYYQDAIIITF